MTWQKVHVPFVERAVLLELSQRWGATEEEALRRILRDAAIRELTEQATALERDVTCQEACSGQHS